MFPCVGCILGRNEIREKQLGCVLVRFFVQNRSKSKVKKVCIKSINHNGSDHADYLHVCGCRLFQRGEKGN